MKQGLWIVSLLVAASLSTQPAHVSAQFLGNLGDAVPGQDAVSVGILFGQMNPQTHFRDGGSFDSSTLIGATLGFWLNRYMGVELGATRTEHKGLRATDGGVSIVSGRDPRIWTTMVDFVFRYPLMVDAPIVVSPYAALGGGWKSYLWKFDPQGGPDARGFDLAWSYAAGAEARFGANKRVGLRAEYRELRTPIERWGENLTHQDRVLTAGLLLNF